MQCFTAVQRLQICKDPYEWYRHGCRGCGWEAAHEDQVRPVMLVVMWQACMLTQLRAQWVEERDPDFGCGASAIQLPLVLLVSACIAAAMMMASLA